MGDPLLDIDFDEDELDLNEPAPATLELRSATEEQRAAQGRLRTLRDSIYEGSMKLVHDVLHMREIEVDKDGKFPDDPPEAWVEECGEKEAQNRYRIAKASWLNSRAAPVGLTIAQKVVAGISKAEATENSPVPTLNAMLVFAPPTPTSEKSAEKKYSYEVIDVTETDQR